MFQKILIANRGEIACRIAATARRLGIRTVAVHSDADARAQHVLACDESVSLGGLTAADSYLRWERILDACQRTGAQAVHPGYGFLSENEDFAQACLDAGLTFIGPPPSAIRDMGSKAAAKTLMEQAGVPLVPGYHGQDNAPELLQAQARDMGYPVLIKASAGGGGKGMRRVDRDEDFLAALASCQREARSSFGSDHVLVERYVNRPRHIEIQVFADQHGNAVHLFERDCSVQRRHQKVLEEAPAPGMTEERRAQMGAAAVAAARAVGYVGAGTVEFITEQDGRFYFMEMNTRLQVEHPVTEAVTGHDLVEWQLRVASGERLPVTQDRLRLRGHAIEARICAENPQAQFLPSTGRLQVMRWPDHVPARRNAVADPALEPAPVRVDTGFAEGDEITPYYDSLIAKLIVWGDTREQALCRLDTALQSTRIAGLHNNVEFLRRVVNTTSFREAHLDTALIERERAALFEAPGLSIPWALAAVVAHQQFLEQAQEGADPWSRRDAWRLAGPARRQMRLEVASQPFTLTVERGAGSLQVLEVEGERLSFSARYLAEDRFQIELEGQRRILTVHPMGPQWAVFAEAGQRTVSQGTHQAEVSAAGAGGRLTAPMPGKLLSCLVATGERVKAGQALAVLEAMKMEHTIVAPQAGAVAEWLFQAGDQVPEGAELLRLDDASAAS